MRDLSAHIFYKTSFEISSNQGKLDILQYLVMNIIRGWITKKYKEDDNIRDMKDWNWEDAMSNCDFSARKVMMHTISYIPQNVEIDSFKKYWACTIRERQEMYGCASRTWVTEIGFRQTGENSGLFSYIVYYLNGTGYFGRTQEVPADNIPNVIKRLLESRSVRCISNSTTLKYNVRRISLGEANVFAEELLDAERDIPIILYVADSKDIEADDGNGIAGKDILNQVAGNAVVYYASDPEFSEELTFFINSRYWCKPGWIRVYYPRLNINDPIDGSRHRYFTQENIANIGKDEVLKIIRRLFSREIEYANEGLLFRIEDCESLINQAKNKKVREDYVLKLNEEKSKNNENESFFTEYVKSLEDELGSMRRYKEEYERVSDELRFEKSKFDNRQAEFNDLYERVRQKEEVLSNVQINHDYPDTPIKVAAYYEAIFGDRIGFTERAKKTLEECNTSTDILWDCFYQMATTLRDLYSNGNTDISGEFQRLSGYDLARGEGKATRENKALMKMRDDIYEGRQIHAEPHVKKGNTDKLQNSVRVYFAYDEVSRKIIVSYCNGRHLDNASTRNV